MSDHIENFHRSINKEIESVKDRFRSLLYPTIHWGNDGRYKEYILKDVLSRRVPESVSLQSGFVRLRQKCTSEIDIILTDKSKSNLFKSNDFCITTPNNVFGIIEVKTKQTLRDLERTLEKLGDNVSLIRKGVAEGKLGGYSECDPWASLFIYDETTINIKNALEIFNKVARKDFKRVIQCACFGPSIFVRFWSTDSFTGWEAYKLNELAYSYFISNQIWQDTPMTIDSAPWFALKDGKNPHLMERVAFDYR